MKTFTEFLSEAPKDTQWGKDMFGGYYRYLDGVRLSLRSSSSDGRDGKKGYRGKIGTGESIPSISGTIDDLEELKIKLEKKFRGEQKPH